MLFRSRQHARLHKHHSPRNRRELNSSKNRSMICGRQQTFAREFFARFTANDIEGALATMTDDATWWIPGKKDRSPSAGLYPKEKIGRLFHRMVAALKDGLTMRAKSSIGESNFVALEVESSGDLKNGRFYRQEYHMLMQFRDGKIATVREYLDTQHASDVWASPPIEPQDAFPAGRQPETS